MIPKLSSIVILNLIANLPFLYHKPKTRGDAHCLILIISNPLPSISFKWRALLTGVATVSAGDLPGF